MGDGDGFVEVPIFIGEDLEQWISWIEKYFSDQGFTECQNYLSHMVSLKVKLGLSRDVKKKPSVEVAVCQKEAVGEDLFVSLEKLFQEEQTGEQKGTDVEKSEPVCQVFDQMPIKGKVKKKKRWKKLSPEIGFELSGDANFVKVLVDRKEESMKIDSPHLLERKMSQEEQSAEPKKTGATMTLNARQVFDKMIKEKKRKQKKKKSCRRHKTISSGKTRRKGEQLGAKVNKDTHLLVVERLWKGQIVFIIKKRTKLKLERKFTKCNNGVQALLYVKLLWRFITDKRKQSLTTGMRAKFRKKHHERKVDVVKKEVQGIVKFLQRDANSHSDFSVMQGRIPCQRMMTNLKRFVAACRRRHRYSNFAPHTMKLSGTILQKEVVVMFDFGETCFGVLMETCLAVQREDTCKGLVLKLHNMLLVTWLETLRSMEVDWRLQEMKFQSEGVAIILKIDLSLSNSSESLQTWKVRELEELRVTFAALPDANIHPIFKVFKVKKAGEDNQSQFLYQPRSQKILEAEPEAISGIRLNMKIKIERQFEDFNLEDKVDFKGGGIDRRY
ncbi:unnamed protein product [Arabidopsis halleri]